MTAEDARKLSNNPDITKRHLRDIYDRVEAVARNGATSTSVPARFECSDIRVRVVWQLKEDGFQIKEVDDQRDGDFIQISWKA